MGVGDDIVVGGEGAEGDTIGGDRDAPEFLDPSEIEEFDVGARATAFEVEQEIGPTGNRVYRRIAQLRERLVEGCLLYTSPSPRD